METHTLSKRTFSISSHKNYLLTEILESISVKIQQRGAESMKRVLFIRGGFHKEFAYKTFFRSGNEMIMMDVADSMQLPLADYQYVINDIRDTEEMYTVAKKIYKEVGFDGIITFMNSPATAIGRLSDELGFDYFSEESGKLMSNKFLIREKLSSLNENLVRYTKVTSLEEAYEAAEKLGYPWVLKPTDTASSIGVSVIHNKDEIAKAYEFTIKASFNKCLIGEEFITGEEHCAELIVIEGQPYVLGISKKIIDENSGCIELIDITPAPRYNEIYEEAKRYFSKVGKLLDIRNWMIHIEFKAEDGKIRIIELNPRVAGANIAESEWHLRNFNIYDLLYKTILKEKIDVEELERKIQMPHKGYTAFYSYITPHKEGVIKKINGMRQVRETMGQKERINSYVKEGEHIKLPASNADFRGAIYTMGDDYKELMERVKKVESSIDYEIE